MPELKDDQNISTAFEQNDTVIENDNSTRNTNQLLESENLPRLFLKTNHEAGRSNNHSCNPNCTDHALTKGVNSGVPLNSSNEYWSCYDANDLPSKPNNFCMEESF